jgi:hypothetical protein
MTDFIEPRRVVSVCPCAGGGEAAYCDDGAVFYSIPHGDLPRTYTEGNPVPGSARAVEIGTLIRDVREREINLSAVCGNLGQVLINTAYWLEQYLKTLPDGSVVPNVDTLHLREALNAQLTAHGVSL